MVLLYCFLSLGRCIGELGNVGSKNLEWHVQGNKLTQYGNGRSSVWAVSKWLLCHFRILIFFLQITKIHIGHDN